jgi:hypothetical protein
LWLHSKSKEFKPPRTTRTQRKRNNTALKRYRFPFI